MSKKWLCTGDVMETTGHTSEMFVGLCKAIERCKAHSGIISALVGPEREVVLDAMVRAMVDNAPPSYDRHIVSSAWSDPIVQQFLRGDIVNIRNTLDAICAEACSGHHLEGSINCGMLEKFPDIGLSPHDNGTAFHVVRFWKGWSIEKILEIADGMKWVIPSAVDIIHFAVYLHTKINCNWDIIPPGYCISNTLMVPQIVSWDDMRVVPCVMVRQGSVLVQHMTMSERLLGKSPEDTYLKGRVIPNTSDSEVNGFGTVLPMLFVDKS